MRVLIAGANRTIEGGAETYQRSLIPALRSRGHVVALLHERAVAGGMATVDQDAPGIPIWSAAAAGQDAVLARVADWRPDVAYVQGLTSPALERALVSQFAGVLFAHAYYGTCETGTKRHAFPALALCTRRFGPACLFLHYPRRCGGLNPVVMASMYALQRARRDLLARYRAICVASRHMETEYLRHAVPPDRIHVLPPPPAGVEPDASPPEQRPLTGHVVLIARLTDLKGGDYLIRAIPQAAQRLERPLHLTVLGDGPERAALVQLAQRLGVAATFRHWVTADRRNEVLRSADIVAVPSVWPEPWGLAGLEAACLGVPAVAFGVGGIPEWLVPGQSGELAPASPPTVGGLAQALFRALESEPHHAALRRGAWEQARRHTMTDHVTRLLAVFESAAG